MAILWLLIFILIVTLFVKTRNLRLDLSKRIDGLEKSLEVLTKHIYTGQEQDEKDFDQKKEPIKETAPDRDKAEEGLDIISEPELESDESPPSEQPPPLPSFQYDHDDPDFIYEKATSDTNTGPGKESDLREKWMQFKENVDWEKFTGIKLFAWLGGIALFIGAGFFVKYSIDRNLIPPTVRLVIGAITGLALIIASGRFERVRYDIMRHTLAASGIGVLYSVLFAATLYYQYLPKMIGFGCLTIVSATAFVLALYHRGIAISVLGAIGAYATPILVNTGQGNLIMLFLYLAIVNIGLYQVTRRLKSLGLLLVATVGTLASLSLGTFMASPSPPSLSIAIVWIANMALFSVFLDLMKPDTGNSRYLLWSGKLLYLSVLGMAFALMLNRSGSSPMLLLTAAIAGAVALARNNREWYRRVIPYSCLTFIAAVLWTLLRFNPQGASWSFLLFFTFGVVGGLGPVLLIIKYGLDKSFLDWFKTFPVAIAGLSLIALFKDPSVSFWFWPMTIGLQVLGMVVSLLFGAIIQIGILSLFLIIGGLIWITNVPPDFISYGFYGFTFLAGALLCIVIFYVIGKLPEWSRLLKIDTESKQDSFQIMSGLTQWIVASPAMAAFLLLAASFISQRPLYPNPGMTTLLCFLVLTMALCKRLFSQPMGMVALLSSVFAQSVWMLNSGNSLELHFIALIWSNAFFICAILLPFVIFRSYIKWDRLWMVWAIFEIFQGTFMIWAADHLWDREIAGWLPFILAFLKLPAIKILIKHLDGMEQRNSILAFHGGVLLFYVSAVPIMLLDQGWIGLTLVFEATALLWLNQRVEHPGLRWVSTFMAPAGLFLLFTYLPQMKGLESLIIINSAVISVAACVIALSWAVRLAPFPSPMLGKIDLPRYFLWLAIGSGFYFVNLIVADIFAGPNMATGLSFKFLPRGNILHSIIYALLWTGFGSILWRIGVIPKTMRITGLFLLCLSTGWLILFPFIRPGAIAEMSPLTNIGLLAYIPVICILLFLFLKEPWIEKPASIKNLFLALFLITGFIFIKIEKSTLFQPGQVLNLLHSSTPSMAVASSAGWLAYGLGMLLWPKRLDRPFRAAGVILILLGLIKSIILPFNFRIEFSEMTPIINAPTLLYLFCLASLIYLTLKKTYSIWPFKDLPPRSFWGLLLAVTAFCVLNIEIASVFGIKGRPFSLLTHGSLSHQLGYSLGWLAFSICLLSIGIKWSVVNARWASLLLLVITSLKIFFKDLWSLGQLYRVASFVGLAAVLILVSFLYQRFLSDRRKDVS